MDQPLHFDKSSCTQQTMDRIKDEYGGKNLKFACEPSPYGGKECIAALETLPSSGKTYPATLDGCNQCTAECGVVVGPGEKDDDKNRGSSGAVSDDVKNAAKKVGKFTRSHWLLLLVVLLVLVIAIMILKKRK